MPETQATKTALVLAGGGSYGAVQVGMLKALVAAGIKADFVVGSSVGAINGAYYAGAPTPDGIERLDALWRGITRNEIFPVNWHSLLGFVRHRDFLVSSHGIRGLVERHLPYCNLEDAGIPIYVIATDVLSGGSVVLSKGSAAEAIAASTALPVAFAPVRLGQQF
jgi:NTE family protein